MSDDRSDNDDRAVKGEPISEPPAPSPGAGDAPVAARGGRLMRLLVGVAAVILVSDLVTKVLAVEFIDPRDPIRIVGDTVTLTLIRNPGAAFSMATGMTWLLTLVAVGVVIGVIRLGRKLGSRWWALGLGLVLGGALGNLIDRIFRSPGPLQGHVVDFVSVGWWPVFNVADSAIVCGAVLLVALTLFGVEPTGTKPGSAPDEKPDEKTGEATSGQESKGDVA